MNKNFFHKSKQKELLAEMNKKQKELFVFHTLLLAELKRRKEILT